MWGPKRMMMGTCYYFLCPLGVKNTGPGEGKISSSWETHFKILNKVISDSSIGLIQDRFIFSSNSFSKEWEEMGFSGTFHCIAYIIGLHIMLSSSV